jgi:regulator of sigma E protease
VSIDGIPVKDFYNITTDIILDEAKTIQVSRNGKDTSLNLPKGTIRRLIKSKAQFVTPRSFPIVDTVFSDVAKFTSGDLKTGDRILAINNKEFNFYDEIMKERGSFKNQEIALTVLRNSDTVLVKAKTDSLGRIGFWTDTEGRNGAYKQKYGFLQSFPAGIRKGWRMLVMNVKNFKLLFTSDEVKTSESLGSFLSIGNMFGPEWDWEVFWSMTALLSIVLAFMNILPIPALDGGHVIFTLYEMITGRKPGDKFMEYAQMVGMILLLGLMAYALGLDFWRFLFK